jgi:hypothetical protein
MPLTKLQFRPGINREITSYSNEGGWHDCDKVRFTKGFPEKIGGWVKKGVLSFLGTARAMHPWRDLIGTPLIGLGTDLKFYIEEGGGYNDITPIRTTTAAGEVTFSATDGSSTVVVSDVGHGAIAGDFVTYTDATGLGGNVTAGVLNQEYQIIAVTDTDTYSIQVREAGTSISSITVDGELAPVLVVANSSDTGNGGASTVGAYQINSGLETALYGNGWGAGFWSRGAWGSATDINTLTTNLRTWSQDNFGEDLIFNPHNGGIYYWDRSASYTTYQRAIPISELAGSSGAPTVAKHVLVSDRDRHVLAFGCDAVDNIGVQDPLLIRFSDQENAADWTPTATNTAGDLRIGSGSEIRGVVETRQQTLVFTDTSLHAMQYLGPPFTFGINMISENISLQGPNAGIAVDDMVLWMGETEFYMYNGSVQRIPCSVRSYVFDDFNFGQGAKAFAALNSAHSEVWWFYPSASSANVDKYVVYNYAEQTWYYGSMARSTWIDRGAFENPLAAGLDGYLYEHEVGFDDGSTSPASAIDSYIQSSPIDLGDGEQFLLTRRVFPDIVFKNSTAESPSADVTINVRNISQGSYVRSATGTYFNNDREQLNMRLRGRQFSFKVSCDNTQTTWRLGSPRIDVRPDGRR